MQSKVEKDGEKGNDCGASRYVTIIRYEYMIILLSMDRN